MRRDEQLSALMDDDVSKDELRFLLKGLETDQEGRDKWSRYHQIGAALRGEYETAITADLSSRVMAEIEANPEQDGAEPAWMKRVVQFAVAASVASVAVFVANDRGFIGAAAPVAGITAPASVAAAPIARDGRAADWQAVSPEVQEQLDSYIAKPEENIAEPSLAPPVRLVGHRQEVEEESEELEATTADQ